MRTIDCPCAHRLEGADDHEVLFWELIGDGGTVFSY
jgi:hypothetical protein